MAQKDLFYYFYVSYKILKTETSQRFQLNLYLIYTVYYYFLSQMKYCHEIIVHHFR